jgi:drug/metabolite transporter (DMT)-like permease
VGLFLALAFLALIVALWAFVMVRFRMRWWTIILTLVVLGVLFFSFFRAEDEDAEGDPSGRGSGHAEQV